MNDLRTIIDVNTNPMVFEDLATSLATLATYARSGDLNMPFQDMEHLYKRALKTPPSYGEITALTGRSLNTIDRQRGRAAWLLMNIEGLDVYGVHTRVWHKLGTKYYCPIVDQMATATGQTSAFTDEEMQRQGADLLLLDVIGLKDDVIWLVQVVTNDSPADSALGRISNGGRLFRSNVYEDIVVESKDLQALAAAKRQMKTAFPELEVATLVLVLDSHGPDFELYQVDLSDRVPKEIRLDPGKIRKNSIDFADRLETDNECLFSLTHLLDNNLFKGIPPCRGGRTLGMLGAAVTRQLQADKLLMWERKQFIDMLKVDFDYEVEKDKVRHDLDDRLVAQGFFRKWGPAYFVSMKGIARYQYCLAKFTNIGSQDFNLDQCVTQRDRILGRFGCLA